MKSRILLTLALASGLALAAAAQTPTSAPTGATKIAVISFQAAVGQTNEFQRDLGDLQKKFEPKRAELKKLSDEIESLTKQLQTQGDKLSDTERASRIKSLDEKQKLAKRTSEDAQSDFQQELQTLFGSMASKVGEVMSSYAQQQGFSLVLDASENQQQAPLVLFASPQTDITAAVIAAYNVKSGVPAPPSEAPAPKAAAPKAPAGK